MIGVIALVEQLINQSFGLRDGEFIASFDGCLAGLRGHAVNIDIQLFRILGYFKAVQKLCEELL